MSYVVCRGFKSYLSSSFFFEKRGVQVSCIAFPDDVKIKLHVINHSNKLAQ